MAIAPAATCANAKRIFHELVIVAPRTGSINSNEGLVVASRRCRGPGSSARRRVVRPASQQLRSLCKEPIGDARPFVAEFAGHPRAPPMQLTLTGSASASIDFLGKGAIGDGGAPIPREIGLLCATVWDCAGLPARVSLPELMLDLFAVIAARDEVRMAELGIRLTERPEIDGPPRAYAVQLGALVLLAGQHPVDAERFLATLTPRLSAPEQRGLPLRMPAALARSGRAPHATAR